MARDSLLAVANLDPRDPARNVRTAQAWVVQALRRLVPALVEQAQAKGSGVRGSVLVQQTEADPMRGRRLTRKLLAEAVDRLAGAPELVQVLLLEGEGEQAREARVAVFGGRDGRVTLWATSAFPDPDRATWARRWVEFLGDVLDDADPAYAETSDRGDVMSTELDKALRRSSMESVEESRSALRGYAWMTVLPEELAARLGGAGALAASGAVAQVRPLSAGGVLLRATEIPEEFDDAAMRRLFRLVAPVLPAGQPRDLPGWPEHHHVVYEDASAVR